MYNVEKADKELLDGLDSGEKSNEVTKWTLIYNVLKVLGVTITGVSLAFLGATLPSVIIAGSILGGLCGVYQLKLKPAKDMLKQEEDEKVALALEISSKNGVAVDMKTFEPKLVALEEDTKGASFVQSSNGEEVTYDTIGKKTYYYKYSDITGEERLLACTLHYEEVRELLEDSAGYITYVGSKCSVNGLEENDKNSLSSSVAMQIADYVNHEQQLVDTKKKIKTKSQ